MTRRTMAAALAAVALLAGACSGGDGFEDRDPKGYEACEKWDDRDDKPAEKAEWLVAVEVGEIAKEAKTMAIREALELEPRLEDTNDAGDPYLTIDVAAFEKACDDAEDAA